MLEKPNARYLTLLVFLAAAALIVVGACRGDNYDPSGITDDGGGPDVYADSGDDGTVDSGGDADVDADVDADTDADADTGGCSYPGGPYAFERYATVAPMSWPQAVAASDDMGDANLGAWFCDESVNSVFIQVVTTV